MVKCPAASNPIVQHTRATDYTNHGCRCEAARRDRERRRKQAHLLPPSRVPSIGARRRLQALMVMGWSQPELSLRLGRKRNGSLGSLLWRDTSQLISRDLHERIARLYDELWETPGPSQVTRARARARGWHPPLWWDDDLIDDPTYQPRAASRWRRYDVDPIAVELAVAGHHLPRRLTRGERLAAAEELSRRGHSSHEIAEILQVTPRTIDRDRRDLRQAA